MNGQTATEFQNANHLYHRSKWDALHQKAHG